LSRQIQLLEHSLGVKLFDRTSRTVRLTTAGRFFLVDAVRLLSLAEQSVTKARRISQGKSGQVVVGFTTVMGIDRIPRLVASTQRDLPDIDLVLKEMLGLEQLKALENNTIDIGFVWSLSSRVHLKCKTVGHDPLRIIMPRGHPLAKRDTVALSELNNQPFIMYSPYDGKYFNNLIDSMFVSRKIVPKYVQYLEKVFTVVGLVRAGIGLSIVPASVSQYHIDDIVFKPIDQINVIPEIKMVWREDHRNPALETFCRFALDFFASFRAD
jgi:DNA-binding transcriptional LysR family regulator